jgi:hypothetical protein
MVKNVYGRLTFFHKLSSECVKQAFAILEASARELTKPDTLVLFITKQDLVLLIDQKAVHTNVK